MTATAAPIYGLMAEFETPTELVHAAKGAYDAGYRKMDTYTPYPMNAPIRGFAVGDILTFDQTVATGATYTATGANIGTLALFNALPREVPDAWRGWIALLAVVCVLGAGLDLLVATLRDRKRAR